MKPGKSIMVGGGGGEGSTSKGGIEDAWNTDEEFISWGGRSLEKINEEKHRNHIVHEENEKERDDERKGVGNFVLQRKARS